MTREEAIDDLSVLWERNKEYREALDMAISALEQQPCEDAISREAAINIASLHCLTIDETVKALKQLPSVTPSQHKGHWIERKNVTCLDNVRWKYECSECGYEVRKKHDYCVCGAEMESEK